MADQPNPPMGATPENSPKPETRTAPSTSSANGKTARIVLLIAVLIVLIAGGAFGYRYMLYAASHVSTDDAQLANDVVQIAPQVTGTVTQVLVQDNQFVKAGQLIAVLDDATYRATVQQREADLAAAIAQANGAHLSVSLTRETGAALITQAEGGLSQTLSAIETSKADLARAQAAIAASRASAKAAEAAVSSAQGALDSAVASRQRAADGVSAAEAQVANAKAAARAAAASIDSAAAAYDKAASDARRVRELLRQGAISEQTSDQAAAAERSTRAALEVARQQSEQAQTAVAARMADLSAARQALVAADAGVAQARAQLAAAKEQARAAQAGVRQSEAASRAAAQAVLQARAKKEQSVGVLAQAHTTPRQVAVSRSAHSQANAKIEQARAALEAARIQLGYTRIYAPQAGRISKKTVEVGALVQPGTPLMALVPDKPSWVVANYKETQLADVRPGQRAEITVDGIPNKVFRGHVDSIAAATGATFALLPPDNATGNFTKVVQRIPVKIVIEPGQADADQLRAGMSVVATIETR